MSLAAPHVPMWFVSHSLDRCFDAYDVEWIFKTLSARARASNGRARSQKDPLDCLFSDRFALWTGQFTVMLRAIWIDFYVTVHYVVVMSVRDLVRATPCNVSYTQFLNT